MISVTHCTYYALFLGGMCAAASTILVVAIAKFRSYDKNRDKKQHARLVIILFNFWRFKLEKCRYWGCQLVCVTGYCLNFSFKKTGWVTTEGGRMQCFMKKEDEGLIDVENVETTTSITVLSLPHWPPFCYSFVSSISVFFFALGSTDC